MDTLGFQLSILGWMALQFVVPFIIGRLQQRPTIVIVD